MKKFGFTLIELMIVVAIIAVIAAISIPNLLRAAISSNEASAISSMRTMVTAEKQFITSSISTISGVPQYGTFSALGNAVPPFLDQVLGQASPSKSGYQFSLSLSTGETPEFEMTGLPFHIRSGTRTFFVDTSGVVTWLSGAVDVPDATSPPLQ